MQIRTTKALFPVRFAARWVLDETLKRFLSLLGSYNFETSKILLHLI
jgi:hypothetical protein